MSESIVRELQALRDRTIALHFAAEIDGDEMLADALADVMVALNVALDEVRGRAA